MRSDYGARDWQVKPLVLTKEPIFPEFVVIEGWMLQLYRVRGFSRKVVLYVHGFALPRVSPGSVDYSYSW
jgi:hypothetical protein